LLLAEVLFAMLLAVCLTNRENKEEEIMAKIELKRNFLLTESFLLL
jgi:hypothetical protein